MLAKSHIQRKIFPPDVKKAPKGRKEVMVVLSYERVRADGVREKTTIENGQAWPSLEWPRAQGLGARLEFSGPRPLNEVEERLVAMAQALPAAQP